jgi:hypothetical protein
MAAIHLHRKAPRDTARRDDDGKVVELRTPEGETVVFEGVSPAEAEAKVHDYLAWAS